VKLRPATRDDYDPPMDPPEGEMVLDDEACERHKEPDESCPACGDSS
jgi:hypothetical protein